MKKIILIFLGFSLCYLGSAQIEITNAPRWQLTFRVTDEGGSPIPNANVYAGYYVPPPLGRGEAGSRKEGVTDTNGLVTLSARSGPSVGFGADKVGYYSTSGLSHQWDWKSKIDGKWQPWNQTLDIVLKRIIKPIPMYAKRIDAEPPDNGKPVGYDLMVGDWVGPYGKGINTDIIFTREYNRKSLQDYDYRLTVSFPKVGDGIQQFSASSKNMEGSALRSPHQAPTNGYQPQIVKLNVSHPGQKLVFDYDENRIYIFRVRTATNDLGNVVSTHYGKIYGDFMQFKYYLNPTPNDRNLEFDPRQNLMTNLKPGEGVSEP